ncbi:hypothetical protein ACIA7R_27475 [Micromonospora chalcea]
MSNANQQSDRPSDPGLHGRLDEFLLSNEAEPELIRECFWRFVDRVKEVTELQKRSALLGLAVILAFELLNRRLVSETAVGGFKLAKLDFLKILAPVVASYFFLRMASLGRDRAVYVQIVYRFASSRYTGLYRSELDRLLTQGSGPLVNRVPTTFVDSWRSWPGELASILETLFFYATPIVFCFYSFYQLFGAEGFGSVYVWWSLVTAVVLLLLGVALGSTLPSVYTKDLLRDVPFRPNI